MPAPTTYTAPEPAEKDLLLDFGIHQGGEHPYAFAVFGRANKVDWVDGDAHAGVADPDDATRTLRGNDLGKVWYEERPELGVYTLYVSGEIGPSGLVKMATLIGALNTRIAGGESFEEAVANECYALLAACVALGSTASIQASGVEVRGANPFPA